MNIREMIRARRQSIQREHNYEKSFKKVAQPRVDAAYYQAKEKAMIQQAQEKAKAEVTGPSRLQRFGEGLAAVMNKRNTGSNKQRRSKKSKSGVFNRSAFTNQQRPNNFGGQRPIDLGQSRGSPFNIGGKRKIL